MKVKFVRPEGTEGNIVDLVYFGVKIPEVSPFGTGRAEDEIPQEVNDINFKNLDRKRKVIMGTGRDYKEARRNAISNIEKEVDKGKYDCVSIQTAMPLVNGAVTYCYLGTTFYTFKKFVEKI